jgi:polysaccharide chain length determinant protein (PEP-CTERM system associated)
MTYQNPQAQFFLKNNEVLMMDEKEKPIRFYIDMAIRRKWFIIFPLALSIAISFAVYKNLPKIFRATTLILVQPQTLPESYVRPTITTPISDRLHTVSQEILSRTMLEKVIHTLNLYPELRNRVSIEEVIEKMRKSIEVTIQSEGYRTRSNTFSISYEGQNPQTVMDVVNRLASIFIEENIKGREQQAESASIFLSRQLSDIESQLIRKEAEIKNFRERNMGKLPQQLDANLRILDRLQQQVSTIQTSIKSAEDRSLIFQNQIDQLSKPSPTQVSRTVPQEQGPVGAEILTEKAPDDSVITQWNLLKRELNVARSKYTENHPDVIDLKRKIFNLEPAVKEILEKQKTLEEARRKEMKARQERAAQGRIPLEPVESMNPATERILTQYHEQYTAALLEAERLRGEEKKVREEIAIYQRRIEDTPKLEQELTLLNRDYDLLRTTYQSLKDKKIQSQMAETFEKKYLGGQFKILDPAIYPEKPVRPDRNRILMIGALCGLVAGLGLAWFRESLDESFHSEEELEGELGLPILANLPNISEERG